MGEHRPYWRVLEALRELGNLPRFELDRESEIGKSIAVSLEKAKAFGSSDTGQTIRAALLGSASPSMAERSAPKPKPGRPRSSGYQASDRPLLDEMHDLILSGRAKDRTDAARAVETRASGASPEAKIDRLVRGYSERYLTGNN